MRVFAFVACVTLSAFPAAAQITIGAGSTFDIGNAVVDYGCADLLLAGTLQLSDGALTGLRSVSIGGGGTLDAEQGSLSWSGDWTNLGEFEEGTSTTSLVDGCGVAVSTVNYGETFHALSLTSTQGREIRFASGETTNVTQSFVATGTAGQPLRIRSTIAGSAAITSLAPGATQSVFAVDVADNHATPTVIAPGPPSSYSSIKRSNSDGWFALAAAAVPLFSPLGWFLACAALALAALIRLGGVR
jgi:hypothetical protein